jgi:hypothetical protein
MLGVAAFPLYWPIGQKRETFRQAARFTVDFAHSRSDLLHELDLLHARDVIVSSNVPLRRDGLPQVPDREPQDPGVAVYFTRKNKPYVIACDQFNRVRWNLRAIGMTIEALRSIERNGATSMLEQAFSGFGQLPAKKTWREILGIPLEAYRDRELVAKRYRDLAKEHHPDVGGNPSRMMEINAAYEDAMRELIA